MANATLSQMALDEAAKRGPRCVVRAIGWGPWDGGMVMPGLRSHFAASGVSLISMDQLLPHSYRNSATPARIPPE
jgi:hypothetical protein